MVKKLAVFVFALIAFNTVASAQFKTGDTMFDKALVVLQEDAKKDPVVFTKDMSTTYNVPEAKVTEMSKSGMNAGDIYMALETSKVTKKPIDDVVVVYKANKEKGWGAIAKELGIKPGSAEFKALKSNTETKNKNTAAKNKNAKKAKGKN